MFSYVINSTWTVCLAHRSSLGIGWQRGENRCRAPAGLAKHTNKRKADRGIGQNEVQENSPLHGGLCSCRIWYVINHVTPKLSVRSVLCMPRTIGIRNCKSKLYFHFNNGIAFCSAQFYDSCLWSVSCCACNIVSGTFWQLFFPKFPLAVVALVIASRLDTVLYALTMFFFFKGEFIKYLVRAHRFTEGTRYAIFAPSPSEESLTEGYYV